MTHFLIREIRIKGLFGYLYHRIPLHPAGITFIHGPNGCGKTTVLRLIHALFTLDFSALADIDYLSLEIENTNGSVFFVDRTPSSSSSPDRPVPELTIGLRHSPGTAFRYWRDLHDSPSGPLSRLSRVIPTLDRVGPQEWLDSATGAILTLDDLVGRYGPGLFSGQHEVPAWIAEYVRRIQVHYIKTQRLLKIGKPQSGRSSKDDGAVSDVIHIYSKELKSLISRKLAEQAAVSQQYDRSFPERLLSLSDTETVSETEIRDRYARTEARIQNLVLAGLIDEQQNPPLPQKRITSEQRRVLSLYLSDVNKKLDVFDDLQRKIQAFLRILSSKLRTKYLSVSREHGLVIYSMFREGERLLPTQLSSGEQHQIVLFYELIFKADNNALFLIDEPEISLHVDWQRRFLSDLREIAELGDRYFLIATHSPQIIGSHRDLAVALEEGILHG